MFTYSVRTRRGILRRISTHAHRKPLLAALLIATICVLVSSSARAQSLSIDVKVSKDQSTPSSTSTTPAFSTTATNELLLAFVSSDSTSSPNTTVSGVTGAGLTWELVERTNVQLGTAEIWRAFAKTELSNVTVKVTLTQSVASSVTVLTFKGADPSGFNGSGAIGAVGSGNSDPGAPAASLVTTRNNSWVFGVGNDWDNAIDRTPGANQTLVHQYLATVNDTYWVQEQNSPTPQSGTTVTINDTAPTTDRYNLSIVEVLPAQTPPLNSGPLNVDVQVSSDKTPSSSNTTPTFSTTAGNELLLAFVSSDSTTTPNTTVTGITGGGLTWQLVKRTNVQLGTAEIWRAFAVNLLANVTVKVSLSQSVANSVTVISFIGADPSGTNGSGAIGASGTGNAHPGAPSASVVTTRSNSWVFAVGNDWDNAVSRTPAAGQSLVHQYLATVNDTYWVQSENLPTPQSGTTVTISDTAPTTDRYNLSVVEVLPANSTPPTITASLSPSPNAGGWNNSNVTVTFTCTAGSYPIQTCPPQVVVSTEAANQVISGTTTDTSGNSATTSVTVNLDKTRPTIIAVASPSPNANGWNNSTVTVNFSCGDTLSGVAACSGPVMVSTEGANQVVTGVATDIAGNASTVSTTFNLDKTPPALSVTSPTNGATLTSSALTVTGSVSDALSGVAAVTCNGSAGSLQSGSFACSLTLTPGANTITVQATDLAGNTVTQSESVTFSAGPTIASFSPTSASVGALIAVTGTNFTANGATPQVTLALAGGGTLPAPVSGVTSTSLSFVVPTGAATGPVTVSVNGQSATSPNALTVQSASTFALTVSPSSATLLPGQSTTYQVSLTSSNGFTQLAMLSVSGLPPGVSSSFQPSQITAGGFSTLTVTAPASQALGSSQLTITANATAQGSPLSATANATLVIQAEGGVAFQGRVAVTNPSVDVPLVGVTVRFTGLNYTGNSTGCTGSVTTDSGGNFVFASLPPACAGPQLVQYDPSTVMAPSGTYTGLAVSYVLTSGQVTTPGVVVHLPRVDNAETVQVMQNGSADQVFTFNTVPGVTITVYAGTTLTLPDGTQPNPFPLRVVEIPYDRLPEQVQPDPTRVPVFAMSIEPFNTTASQPISVSYPNRSNLAPGTAMPLATLSPVLGMMVNYGTAAVSPDGSQIVPNLDPAYPGHNFGITHFDWEFPTPPPPPGGGPNGGPGPGPRGGDPVDIASGLLVVTKTDLAFGGARGQVAITRTFRSQSTNPGPFGIGTNHNYGLLLDFSSLINGTGTELNLIMPDGSQLPFVQQSTGKWINTTIPSLAGAIITAPAFDNYLLTYKNGTAFRFTYFETGQPVAVLVSITDTNGNVVTLAHTSSVPNQITQIVDSVGRSTSLTYDGSSRITSITDPLGRSVSYTYNAQGTLATVHDVAGGVTSYTYDGQNNLISITDPRNITYLTNSYDACGRVTQQTSADGGVTTFSYTLLNPSACTSPVDTAVLTDPNGNSTTYHFNPSGFLLDSTDPLGETTVYNVQSGTNQTQSVTDPLGRTTAYTYDASGNTTSITQLALPPGSTLVGGASPSVTTSFAYDPTFNKVTSITDPLGLTMTFKYDNKGNLVSLTDPANEQTKFAYDTTGELTSATDPLGNTAQFAYTNGDLTRATDALGRSEIRTFDSADRLIGLANALGQSTQYQYNPLNQETRVTDPTGNSMSFSYDANGNLSSVTDGNSHTTLYAYDSMDRVLTRTDPLGRAENYLYDLNGNLKQFTDRRGIATSFSYDALNRKIGTNFGGQSSIVYAYDVAGRLTQATDSISGAIQRFYDGLDRLTSEVTPQGSVGYTYDTDSRRTGMTVSGQAAVAYSYDNASRLIQVTQGASNVHASYDSASRRTNLTLPNGVTITYGYDAASELTSSNYVLGSSTLGNFAYSYDLAGRRTSSSGSFAQTGLPTALTTANYNAGNQLTQFGTSSLTYDANGNMTSDGINTYTWDARNHLVSITGAVSANFQYDSFGRRVSKTISGTTEFLYDGLNPVEELSGGTTSANLLTGLSVDEFFQRTDNSGGANFLTDVLGSTIELSNNAGSSLAQFTYDPFGNTTPGGASSNPYQFTGRENDGDGLYFNRSRYYSPLLQRFVSEDPIQFAGGANFYAYAGNDPVDFTDVLGTSRKRDFGQCIQQNAHFYSLAGVVDLVFDTNTSETVAGNIIGGNDVTGLALLVAGEPENAPESLGAAVAVSVDEGIPAGIGNQLFVGGNSPNHVQTLFPQVGRPPQALPRDPSLTNALKIGKEIIELKKAIDLGFTGALALDCAIGAI